MKKIIVTKKQLNEYVQRKKNLKTYYAIVESLYSNSKFLNENVSLKKANQSVIDTYQKRGVITNEVFNLLRKNNIVDNNCKIL